MTDFLLHIGWLMLSMSAVILLLLLLFKLFGRRFSAKSRYIVWTVVIISLCVGIGLFRLPNLFTVEVSMPEFAREVPDLSDTAPVTAETAGITVPADLNPHMTPDNIGTALPKMPAKEPPRLDFPTVIFTVSDQQQKPC